MLLHQLRRVEFLLSYSQCITELLTCTMANRKSSKKVKGESAISRIIRNSTDQISGYARQRYTGKTAAANIARDINMLRTMLNVERKEVTTYSGAVTVSLASPAIQYIPSAAQGSSGTTRDGDSIKIVRIDGSVVFTYGTGTTNLYGTQVFKYFLLRYLKTPSTSGTTAFASTEFLNLDAGGNISTMSLPATDTMENFSVISSGLCELSPTFATAVNNYAYRQVDISCDVDFHQTFNGSASSAIVDNALFWVVVALNPSNTGGGSSVQLTTRLWFVDN